MAMVGDKGAYVGHQQVHTSFTSLCVARKARFYFFMCFLADISRRHHWFAREMTFEVGAQKFHTGDVSDLDSAYDWSCSVGNLLQPVRSSTQIVASSVRNACSSDVISRGN